MATVLEPLVNTTQRECVRIPEVSYKVPSGKSVIIYWIIINLVTYNYSKASVLLKQQYLSRRKVGSGMKPCCKAARFRDQSADAA
jgi:hypothetical protein